MPSGHGVGVTARGPGHRPAAMPSVHRRHTVSSGLPQAAHDVGSASAPTDASAAASCGNMTSLSPAGRCRVVVDTRPWTGIRCERCLWTDGRHLSQPQDTSAEQRENAGHRGGSRREAGMRWLPHLSMATRVRLGFALIALALSAIVDQLIEALPWILLVTTLDLAATVLLATPGGAKASRVRRVQALVIIGAAAVSAGVAMAYGGTGAKALILIPAFNAGLNYGARGALSITALGAATGFGVTWSAARSPSSPAPGCCSGPWARVSWACWVPCPGGWRSTARLLPSTRHWPPRPACCFAGCTSSLTRSTPASTPRRLRRWPCRTWLPARGLPAAPSWWATGLTLRSPSPSAAPTERPGRTRPSPTPCCGAPGRTAPPP